LAVSIARATMSAIFTKSSRIASLPQEWALSQQVLDDLHGLAAWRWAISPALGTRPLEIGGD